MLPELPHELKAKIAAYMQEHGWEDCTPETVQKVYNYRNAEEMPVTAGLAGNIIHELEKADLLK